MKIKKTALTFFMVITTLFIYAQKHMITLSGGYAFGKIDDSYYYNVVDVRASGYRINVVYEYIYEEQPIAYGFLVGYANLKASEQVTNQTVDATIYTVPITFSPKYLIGKGWFKGFIKADVGMQLSGINRTGGATELKTDAVGFLIGGAAGVTFDIADRLFINLEYQLDWLTNGYYNGGWLNSPMLGIGWKFKK